MRAGQESDDRVRTKKTGPDRIQEMKKLFTGSIGGGIMAVQGNEEEYFWSDKVCFVIPGDIYNNYPGSRDCTTGECSKCNSNHYGYNGNPDGHEHPTAPGLCFCRF